jgi:hypothetical protein
MQSLIGKVDGVPGSTVEDEITADPSVAQKLLDSLSRQSCQHIFLPPHHPRQGFIPVFHHVLVLITRTPW